jgi:hypothetical protein
MLENDVRRAAMRPRQPLSDRSQFENVPQTRIIDGGEQSLLSDERRVGRVFPDDDGDDVDFDEETIADEDSVGGKQHDEHDPSCSNSHVVSAYCSALSSTYRV